MVQAENITTPDIVSYVAGTPAKASEVNGNFEGLKAYGEGLHGLVEDQETRISDLETSTDALSVTVDGHTTDITDITNTAAITTLQTDTGTNGSNITALQTSVATNTSNITALKTSTSTNISSLQATTTTNATAINALESSDITQNGLISAQANLIDALEARIEELESSSGGSAFNIAVYGDGDLISYTNKVNAFSPNKHFIP